MTAQTPPKKPGRPKGSKTKTTTPAMKMARKYLELIIDGMAPTKALRRLAGESQYSENTIRRDWYRHAARVGNEYQRDLESKFNAYAATLCDPDKVIAAMNEASEWRAELLAKWKATLPAELAALESEAEIHARLSDVVHDGLLELSRRASARADELANEPGSDIDPAIPHGGVIYLKQMAERLSRAGEVINCHSQQHA